METYFVNPKHTQSENSSDAGSNSEVQTGIPSGNSKNHGPYGKVNQRLVDWMTDLLLDHTRKVVCMHKHSKLRASVSAPAYHIAKGVTCMDEVKDVIEMPLYNAKLLEVNQNYKSTKITEEVTENLRAYVGRIASGYRDNPFHNFGKVFCLL